MLFFPRSFTDNLRFSCLTDHGGVHTKKNLAIQYECTKCVGCNVCQEEVGRYLVTGFVSAD